MIIDKDSRPKDTVYYISGCILATLRSKSAEVDSLFELIRNKYNDSLEYSIFLLALDFLFLINKIEISEKGVLKCISNG
ncbi:hypothetical protein B7C51_09790 [Paenibacillus larvae subsp. pulvifaciens]|uniref:Uncharacterized protein n=1 Tax=Paenibacillus larvae subsp. pulvifaciens TaxID=1477 RepID=A0A1V0URZ9_9BACL|nr:ABC-three component system middle component 6 [Paenibacillus larvae]ARF68059.1 hypothetical protein B7C51_09790 [Paenibacillus larvae subsp. pulvifaciens]MCY9511806.1 hypothetical protein [Paenibacillus larvae]MCY9527329.1 hypothetical protein [Paenibacillus larvae]